MSFYHNRKPLDWIMLSIVVIIAGIVIALSFHNTATLAGELSLNPYLTAGLVEILFASLLFIRGRQRATQRNVPLFLETGYFVSLGFVTGVNMYGLAQENPVLGPIFGLAISGAMWLMETTLVWLWTSSHEPYQKSLRERKREAKLEVKEMREIQYIEWLKSEAQKPDLSLIRKARAADEKRKEVVGDGLPEFFRQEIEPVKKIIAKLEETKPKTVDVQEPEHEPVHTVEVVPMRQIGFHAESPKPKPEPGPAPLFQPNLEAREKAIQTAKQLKEELGRLPKKRELIEKGLSDHYARMALGELKNH